jgi:hypothetical protein
LVRGVEMRYAGFLVVALLCVTLVAGCPGKKAEERGYDDDSKIGTGQDPVDGYIGVPLRAAREAEIVSFLYSVNSLIQTESALTGKNPANLDEVAALWKKETRKDWPPPAFRYKYTYDAQTGKVGEVHKTREEYTPEEAASGEK